MSHRDDLRFEKLEERLNKVEQILNAHGVSLVCIEDFLSQIEAVRADQPPMFVSSGE